MSVVAHHAICSLFRRFTYDCKRFRSNEQQMQALSEDYLHSRRLLREQEDACDQIIKIFGILGVHSPDVSTDLARCVVSGISEDMANLIYSGIPEKDRLAVNSSDIRGSLKLWQILELFLEAVDGRATPGDFRDFLFQLDMQEKGTPQAIESAVKTHSDLFEEIFDSGQKYLALKRRLNKNGFRSVQHPRQELLVELPSVEVSMVSATSSDLALSRQI